MSMFGFACSLCWDRNCNCDPEAVQAYEENIRSDIETKQKKMKDEFNEWFGDLLLNQGQTCLMRDVLRDSKATLFENWQKRDPYQ
jgi:hypothetical protein